MHQVIIIALIRANFYAFAPEDWDTPRSVNKEDVMKYLPLLVLAGAFAASPAVAHHAENLNTPFPSRGACEAKMVSLSNDDDFLLDAFPQLFSSEGEVRSFLNRAFTCDLNEGDGQTYISDHRLEVLGSDWFLRRQ